VFLILARGEALLSPDASAPPDMAQHKAPTAVTFATPESNTGMKSFVQRYWKVAALVAVAGSGVAIYSTIASQEGTKKLYGSWDALNEVGKVSETNLVAYKAPPADILKGEAAMRGTAAGPWALWIAATNAANKDDWDTAVEALDQLVRSYPNHTLVKDKQPLGADGAPISMVDELLRRYKEQKAWRASHADLFANPVPPADAPKVRIKTDKGDILIALYAKEAPKHVENFLKLCRDGYYAGTKFHRTTKGSKIEGGDPNSKADDRTKWGQGGPDYKLDREENNLHHFEGYLAAVKLGRDTQSSGSQFYITSGDKLTLDGQDVVFGKVLEGMAVVHQIEDGEIEASSLDQPKTPVAILSTEVL
jgi:cyclophilin family peptidyl-prolyl cis-trans isomerase